MESVGPEERHRIYKLLKLKVETQRDGSVTMNGGVSLLHSFTAKKHSRAAVDDGAEWSSSGRIGRHAVIFDWPDGLYEQGGR